MANRMIAIALLSLGMVAMNESAALWQDILATPTIQPSPDEAIPSSRLFIISSADQNVFPSPERGKLFTNSSIGQIGMIIHSCTDGFGIEWSYVVMKQTNGKYFWGWVENASFDALTLSQAPAEWVRVQQLWGW